MREREELEAVIEGYLNASDAVDWIEGDLFRNDGEAKRGIATALISSGYTKGNGEPVAYLRDAQPDAEDEALFVCAKGDSGCFPVYAAPVPGKGNGELVEAAIAVICEWDDLNSPDVDCTGFGGGAPEPDSPAMARLRKALSDSEEAGPSGDGWQPIETAPKDGTEIVARDAATGTSHVTYWTLDWHDPDNHHYSEAPGFSPHPLDAPPRPASSPRASWRWRQG
tara:strand:- start:4053 stop:4724 length:672 start_codon:yes stop_codon:yes gene_type:complete